MSSTRLPGGVVHRLPADLREALIANSVALAAWKDIVGRYMTQWTTHGQKATLEAEYNRGIATGKSWREVGAALGQIIKSWQRGR